MNIQIEARRSILDKAAVAVLTDRSASYGEPESNFAAIAALWEVYDRFSPPGVHTPEHDVSMKMVLLKIGRIMTGKIPVEDNYVDGAGYFATAYGVECGLPKTPEPDAAIQTAKNRVLDREDRFGYPGE